MAFKKSERKTRKKRKSNKNKLESTNILNDGKVRIPRPQGITLLSRNYKQDKNIKTLSQIHNLIIGQFIQTGFRINNQPTNIQELANYLQIPFPTLLKKIHNQIRIISGGSDPKALESTMSALQNLAFFGALEARHIALHQVKNLMRIQGDNYVPFLTGNTNQAIANLIMAEKQNVNLLATMMGKNGTNIQINNNQGLVQNNNYLTTEMAVKILNERAHNGLLRKDNLKGLIHQDHGLSQMPEVVATKQIGYRSESVPKLDLKIDTTNKAIHEERNELDGDIMVEGL